MRFLRVAGKPASAALVLVAVTLVIVGGNRHDGQRPNVGPRIVTKADLEALEKRLNHPIYWAGERSPNRLELTQGAGGNVYLPPWAAAGAARATFLSVSTYPGSGGPTTLHRAAEAANASVLPLASGGIVFVDPPSGDSAYLALPGSELQVEVYHPAAGRAMELIRSGEIGPAGE